MGVVNVLQNSNLSVHDSQNKPKDHKQYRQCGQRQNTSRTAG